MAEKVNELCEFFTKSGIVSECEKRGLATDGCKKEMAQRIAYHDIETANDGRLCISDGVPNNELQGGHNDEAKAPNDGNSVHDDEADDAESHDNDDRSDYGEELKEEEFSFHTANGRHLTSTTRRRVTIERRQPYSFRDVEDRLSQLEDSIETYGAEDGQDVKVWMAQFEAISRTAHWYDEQKLIMCRKKLTGTARRFMFALRDITTFAKLKAALIKEFSPFVRASDIHRQLAARKKKSDETIRDYIYEMQRIAQSIELDEPSVCEYIVDEITDDEFHHAMLYEAQNIRQLKEKLLNFEKVQKKIVAKKPHDVYPRKKELRELKKLPTVKKNCYNCGDTSHIAEDCPQKNDGPKCFRCNQYGHMSRNCAKSDEKSKYDGVKKCISKVNTMKSVKSAYPNVLINICGNEVSATVDTGSEISLIRKDFWEKLPDHDQKLKKSEIKVRGYGGNAKAVCGKALLDVSIGNQSYEMLVYVVPKEAIDMKVLVGMDFLCGVNYSITRDGVRISKLPKESYDDDHDISLKWIHVIEEYGDIGEIDVPYKYRDEVKNLIRNYQPVSSVTAANKLKITLCDSDVVCVNPRRLAPFEKEIVKKQTDDWLANGIIQPSHSEYSSAVVVVPKKDGSRRVCIDYREINKKVIRDNFPMPNVEEQIDQLASARV
ncbi:uncharacterized protein LOC129753039 [Uranotaenia lowii]|uniref:uncharacterized protein LOC129753039 n=1 Tax=Uranotaenia lowii TaxID=190385 RepID=UPI00247AB5F6|nr:uncharacterized protein LOC129753039 [Uranotaenia lowii]